MSSYFAEHDCTPLNAGETPNHLAHFARLVATGAYWEELGLQFTDLFGHKPTPATSKAVISELKTTKVDKENKDKCAVCLKPYQEGEECKHLPCSHVFHTGCILPWLQKTNTCPMCRHEMKTDDPEYEAYRTHQKRESERKAQLETLHESMFS